MDRRKLSGALGPALLLGGFVALTWAERRRPLRRAEEDSPRRLARNLAMAGLTAAAVQAAERPAVAPLARAVARRRLGLLPALRLPPRLELIGGVLLMDYTLYIWHVLTHRVPLLWRFHRVHHADLDLDTTTALRFHFGEFLLSVPFRAAQVALIGVSPRTLELWQRLTLMEVIFHHSNLRLPRALEWRLSRWIVTPRMHGIHHSVRLEERDSNWSSCLSIWDWLHGTLRRDVPQARITIGVPELRRPEQVTLPRLLAMPFQRRPPMPGTPPRAAHPGLRS